jgi:peptidyl-prolyl cis-trans isomerase D
MAFESADLQPIAERLELSIQESALFPRSGGDGLFANRLLVDAAFADDVLEGGFNSDVLELNDSQAIVLRLLERQSASVRPLEEVEAEIAVILRTELEKERAQALGLEILGQLQAGESIDQLLADNELEWIEQNETRRDSVAINREITNAVFSMPAPETAAPLYQGVGLSNGTYVVIELNGVQSGDLAAMPEAERQSIEQSILSQRSQSLFGAYMNYLRENADIRTRVVQDPLL